MPFRWSCTIPLFVIFRWFSIRLPSTSRWTKRARRPLPPFYARPGVRAHVRASASHRRPSRSLAKFNYPASFQSDYAAYPPAASSYPPPNHHYYNHHNHHPPHHRSQYNQHQYHPHHHAGHPHSPHNNIHPLPAAHHHPHHASPHYGLTPPSPAPQDTDFGGSGGLHGSRRLFDLPGGQLGAIGLQQHSLHPQQQHHSHYPHHHLSASSTSSLSGIGLPGSALPSRPGASYNGVGGGGLTNLVVNYLPQDMTDRELFSLFRTMGPMDSCRIMRDFKVSVWWITYLRWVIYENHLYCVAIYICCYIIMKYSLSDFDKT